MNLRLAVEHLAVEHRLDARARGRLERLAGFGVEPASLQRTLVIGVAVLAAALLGLGLIFWVAANWGGLGRFGRFAVLQGALAVLGIAALVRAPQRVPLGLLVLLLSGGLFAYFGQTYQTGADPWQLFALWALLTLPLCLGLRSDALWLPWVIVAMTAVTLWVHAHSGHRWSLQAGGLAVHVVGWALALSVVAAMSPPARAFTGAGVWALRCAAVLAAVMIAMVALDGLFHMRVSAQYPLGLLALAALAALFAMRGSFDAFALSATALGIDTLLVAGLARWLFLDRHGGGPIGPLLLLGLLAAGLLAATVSLVTRLSRLHGAEEHA